MKTTVWVLAVASLFLFVSPAARSGESSDSITTSFTVSKGGRLEVSTEGGDIRILPWDKGEVFVRVDGVSEKDADRLKMTQSGNTVSIRYRSKW